MFSPDDTIVAVATPPGRGGIGVVRISGSDAEGIGRRLARRNDPLEPRRATLCRIDSGGGVSDQAILTFFPAPHSYTGEDVLEISAHGSPVLLTAVVEAAMQGGARLAEPGEFTFRAFLRGRMDLVQAEAVRDLVDAVTPLQARAAFDQLEGTLTSQIRDVDAALFDLNVRLEASLDFPEEGYHFIDHSRAAAEIAEVRRRIDSLVQGSESGRLLRDGAQVTIAGRPNVGKSSLFNALLGAGRAIVTEIPGTTRDLLVERVDVGGFPIALVDTAGIRTGATDPVETEGMQRAAAARNVAAAVLVVLDRSQPLLPDDGHVLAGTSDLARVVVANKADLPAAWQPEDLPRVPLVAVSARTGAGLDDVRSSILAALIGREPLRDVPAVTNVRHAELLRQARSALDRASAAVGAGTPEEFVLQDINDARARLEEITGARSSDDVLGAIFGKFCIGK